MSDKYFNPFASVDILVPVEFKDEFARYCQTGGRAVIDHSPFPRMVDLWFLAVCLAARKDLKAVEIDRRDTYKIIDGSIFSSDPWRVHTLMLIAIAKSGDIGIVVEPRRMIGLANGLATAGFTHVMDMLKEGTAEPIWNLSEAVELLEKEAA